MVVTGRERGKEEIGYMYRGNVEKSWCNRFYDFKTRRRQDRHISQRGKIKTRLRDKIKIKGKTLIWRCNMQRQDSIERQYIRTGEKDSIERQ